MGRGIQAASIRGRESVFVSEREEVCVCVCKREREKQQVKKKKSVRE